MKNSEIVRMIKESILQVYIRELQMIEEKMKEKKEHVTIFGNTGYSRREE